jgi:large subunit ribosomal protein L49
MESLPRPKESRASHRTAHPRAERHYPTRHPTHSSVASPKLIPEPVEPLPPQQCAPNLPYFVSRSRNNELPVYTLRKRGGNLKLTRIKNIDGKPETLRDELRETLRLEKEEASVNPITRHVMLKGHHKPAVERFLRERRF